MTDGIRVRKLNQADVPRILEIQAAAYEPHLLEVGGVFAAKIGAHPDHSLGVEGPDGVLIAYVIAFPMSSTASVGLHETDPRETDPQGDAPVLYVHDMAVHPDAHGSGAGTALLRALEALGAERGQTVIELVAIEPAVGFWRRRGFTATDDEVYPGYGPGARKMRRAL